MGRKRLLGLGTIAALAALVIALAVAGPSASADGDDDLSFIPEKAELKYPNLGSALDRLAVAVENGELSEAQAASQSPIHQEQSAAVTIHLSGNAAQVEAFLRENGGDPRNAGEDYIEAYVPVTLLGALSEQPGVIRVREIVPPEPTQTTQLIPGRGPLAHGSLPWNQAGYNGQGVKVGVIDPWFGFNGFRDLMGTELPTTVQARCYVGIGVFTENLADCESAFFGDSHGTNVAETVMDIAPEASLYIASPLSAGDLQDATDWMVSQGVSVISHSISWTFNGPGDGTSPYSVSPLRTVDRAVDGGIVWVNAAGNAAQGTWFGSYSDLDGNGWINFAERGRDEAIDMQLGAGQEIVVQLRWDDSWRGATRNFDLYIVDDVTRTLLAGSFDRQTGYPGHVPSEYLTFSPPNDGEYDVLVYHRGGDAPDWIQVTVWGIESIEHYTKNGSIGNPAESANPGMLAAGAAPWYDVHTIEDYSSRGPTPDGRVKPEIVGADCGETTLLPLPYGFCGTSQAAPHVAGMAVLVKQRFPGYTPDQVAAYLKGNAEQRETPDPNNTWGHGFALLPPLNTATPPEPPEPPPSGDSCGETITADGTASGQWADGCDSQERDGRHARYYTFTLAQQSQVAITLESADADAYLYLRQGEARSGGALHQNDDHQGSTNSRIEAALPAGTYTIEATTYAAGATGNFTLTVTGLGGGGAPPEPPEPPEPPPSGDACGETITADGTASGQWASGCDSQERDGRHARYYTFTLAQQSQVAIALESADADTYLYLRQGEARSGEALHQNDDHQDSTDSRIEAALPAGTYTIEATTYAAGATGNFTLTVSGLGAAAPPEPPEPPEPPPSGDSCGETITADGTASGQWDGGCDSQERDGRHARYYTFTLAQQSQVAIALESDDADTYLYLRQGEARSGGALHQNDDHQDSTDSRIEAALPAGTYTIEATTYDAGATGNFTLTVTGLGGGATPPEPPPSGDACGETITADGTASGQWASGCDSQERDGRHARYYTFTLAQQSQVAIALESADADTYLYLRQGEARSGEALHQNDDHQDSTDSRIEAALPAGTYTIEATTYAAGSTGNFTLTLSGLAAAAPPEPPEPPPPSGDSCGETITADGTASGQWASGCDSQERDGRHARYYTFTLAQQSQVAITLESSDADAYLYLRQGEARSGGALHQNDDHQGSTNSRIEAALPAGTYTIEATTYDAGTTGNFTLTVSGLGGGAPPEPPEPPPPSGDSCGETITADGTASGRWASGCDSQERDGRHARYYTFTLGQQSQVAITLDSDDADTYLYLRQGEARSGGALHQNDDHQGSTNSRIEAALPAGTYTIEATTYDAGTTGNFTLTVSGLAAAAPTPPASDKEVLVALYNATGGPGWSGKGGWLTDEPIGDWDGVTTDRNGRVTSLYLQDNQLSGEIPPELGNLANLKTLWLSRNQLSGEIPPELGNLANLEWLDLEDNQLSGIPPELGNLASLETWDLSGNQLKGEIPPELGDLANLQRLYLYDNQLSGEIPPELGNLANLKTLWLSRNQLSGEIPPELGNLANLEWLDLEDNQLSGIPPELGNLASLETWDLSGNQLRGEIPPELGDLANLQRLYLYDNQLSGEIPPELGNLANLKTLWLSRNQLSGEIPPELGDLANLEWLDLEDNQLSGIPPELGNLASLETWDLSGNQLKGEIPPELGDLANLQRLYLYDNQLSGEIPPELGNLANLKTLWLSRNQLSGEIPPELGNLANLEWLDLEDNQLSGIPPELGNLASLETWDLSGNQLKGEIPPELGDLANLQRLYLYDNQLSGEIPPELGNLASLESLYLNGNRLTGCVPAGLRDVRFNDFDQLGLPFCGP